MIVLFWNRKSRTIDEYFDSCFSYDMKLDMELFLAVLVHVEKFN